MRAPDEARAGVKPMEDGIIPDRGRRLTSNGARRAKPSVPIGLRAARDLPHGTGTAYVLHRIGDAP